MLKDSLRIPATGEHHPIPIATEFKEIVIEKLSSSLHTNDAKNVRAECTAMKIQLTCPKCLKRMLMQPIHDCAKGTPVQRQ